MLKIARLDALMEIIKTKKYITVKELMNQVDCSHSTLQRDLGLLEERGKITRTYGGVSYIGSINSSVMKREYLMYNRRKLRCLEEKIAIGKKAQSYIEDGDIIFLTHGTTTSQVALQLNDTKEITIVTDGVDIINACEKKPNVQVIATGGLINYKSMQIEHNPYITNTIKNINIKKLIMGVGGLSEKNGITFYDYASFSFLQEIVGEIEKIIVVADHTKFGKIALANFLSMDKVNVVITDGHISNTNQDFLEKDNVECVIAYTD